MRSDGMLHGSSKEVSSRCPISTTSWAFLSPRPTRPGGDWRNGAFIFRRNRGYGGLMGQRRTGRPPRGRDRHRYVFKLEPSIFDPLASAAEKRGLPRGTFLALFAGDALGYRSHWDESVNIDYGDLRLDLAAAQAAAASPAEPFPPIVGLGRPASVYLDREIADPLNAACDAAGIPYGDRLRRILAASVGINSLQQLRETEQAALFDMRRAG